MNTGFGCKNLADLYYNGWGTRQNYSTAKEYYGKACDLGNQEGCDNYARLNKQGY
ncbi:MAG TPA: Sel1 repeat protein [Succinivibrionaceae bacterium]|nr:Sel1 repeat protein [Succinivibrionaceae bacterium]